jgi:hypothetical protein
MKSRRCGLPGPEAPVRYLLLSLILLLGPAWATPSQVDDHRWEGVERIVAIGDIHGDYDAYRQTLYLAGITDRRGRWAAGSTHLVQTGDVPDRGPDTLRIIRHLDGLTRQAQRAGGRVHHLIGNHEAMNVYGDLRYVTPGEFAAFADRRSERRRQRYFEAVVEQMRGEEPDRHAALPEDFREQWMNDHPRGWVEHRQAWDPRWNPDGELFRWVMRSSVAVQLNDLIFVHGGISQNYCHMALAEMTARVHDALQLDGEADLDILGDESGPLWYRGLAGVAPATQPDVIDAMLRRYEARHFVIGHTPTGGVIWPRHDARVILIDTGMSAYYGGHIAWLEIEGGELVAGYPGGRLALPKSDEARKDYLEAVIELDPDNARLRSRLEQLQQSRDEEPESQADPDPSDLEPAVICGSSR